MQRFTIGRWMELVDITDRRKLIVSGTGNHASGFESSHQIPITMTDGDQQDPNEHGKVDLKAFMDMSQSVDCENHNVFFDGYLTVMLVLQST